MLWWHGGILGALAVAIGMPLGVVGGRLLWHAVTDSVDSVYAPRSPWALLVVVAGGLFVISVATGAALSRRAVPHSIARSAEVRMNIDVLAVRSAKTEATERRYRRRDGSACSSASQPR